MVTSVGVQVEEVLSDIGMNARREVNFALWVGGNHFSDGCCILIRMHKVLRFLVLSQL